MRRIQYNYRSHTAKTPVDNGPRTGEIDLELVVSWMASAAPINQREKQFKPVQSPIIVTLAIATGCGFPTLA